MDKLTKWEKETIAAGVPIITWEHEEIRDYLVDCFNRDKDRFTLMAAADTTKRHNLRFVMNHHDLAGDNFGGTLNYNKKERRFDFIEYSDRHNCAVQFSISNPTVAFFSRDFYKPLQKMWPLWISNKNLTHWLLTN